MLLKSTAAILWSQRGCFHTHMSREDSPAERRRLIEATLRQQSSQTRQAVSAPM